MKNKFNHFCIVLSIPLLMACGQQKSVSGYTTRSSDDLIELPRAVSQKQRLSSKDVEKDKLKQFDKTEAEVNRLIASSSYYKGINTDNGKSTTKNGMKAGVGAPFKVIQPIVYETDAPLEQVPEEVKTVIKDTIVITDTKPVMQITKAVQPDTMGFSYSETTLEATPFNPNQISPYIQPSTILKKFSVVTGSFTTLEKAYESVRIMIKSNFKPKVVKNEKGMYRVITGTFDRRADADFHVMELSFESISSWILVK